MISKSQIKLIQSLRHARGREEAGLYVVEGVKMVDELLSSNHETAQIYALDDWKPASDVRNVEIIKEHELQKISNLTTPNKVVALARIPAPTSPVKPDKELVLLLDHISDPGNMGTIIRTAEWFGINRVIASDDSVDFWNPKVVQASMGSVFRMPLHCVSITEYLQQNSGVPVYGTLFNGEDPAKIKLSPYGIIIVGNESRGIAQDVQSFVTTKLTIPAAATSLSESLNASVATAIVCYEFRRQFPV